MKRALFLCLLLLLSVGFADAALYKNVCWKLSNGTPCFNFTGSQMEVTGMFIDWSLILNTPAGYNDTNETTRVENAAGFSCGAGDFVNSFDANLNPACGTPAGGGGGTYNWTATNGTVTDVIEAGETFNFTAGTGIGIQQTAAGIIIENIAGGGGGNPFDQSLNTTDSPTFHNMTLTGNISVDHIYGLSGTLGVGISDDGSDITIHGEVGGVNTLYLATDQAFFGLTANPGAANDYLLASIEETQGAPTQINFYEGGTGHNRFWSSGSVRIGGGQDYLCSNLTSAVDCNTPATGADLVVEDDIWAGGKLLTTDSVGIGDSTPEEKLDVEGNIEVNSNNVTDVECIVFDNGATWCST